MSHNEKFNTVGKLPAKLAVFYFDISVTLQQLQRFVKAMLGLAILAWPSLRNAQVAVVNLRKLAMVHNVFTNLLSESQAQYIFVCIPTSKFKDQFLINSP